MHELSKDQMNSDHQNSRMSDKEEKDALKKFEINEEKLIFFKSLKKASSRYVKSTNAKK